MLKNLVIANKLKAGDTVAVVASSWGGPGTFYHKVQKGIDQLEAEFGVKCIVMPFAKQDAKTVYENPKKRAEELIQCFKNPEIKAIISAIGGDDSIRMLPYIDFDVIKNNPKIYLGYSDSTITHFMCLKAGIRSYYGPSIMSGFSENGGLLPITISSVRKTLFSNDIIGKIEENTSGLLIKQHPWEDEALTNTPRDLLPVQERKIILGSKNAKGRLIGGCMDVLEFMKGTTLWPDMSYWKDSILFIETSEDVHENYILKYWLRNYAEQGILQKLNGIVVGRPKSNQEDYMSFWEEQEQTILTVIRDEYNLDIPILTRFDFGHTDPQIILPYGAMATIDVNEVTLSISESGVKL